MNGDLGPQLPLRSDGSIAVVMPTVMTGTPVRLMSVAATLVNTVATPMTVQANERRT
jgi:hypothetical protein